jgi:hypothetical protein
VVLMMVAAAVVRRKWYAEHALLRQTEEAEVLVGLLGGLTGVDFALDVDVPHLDVTNGLYMLTPPLLRLSGVVPAYAYD